MRLTRNDPALKQNRQELRLNQTDAEKAFWAKVRNRQLRGLRFLRQHSIGPYIVDFYCPSIRPAIELDGGQHNEGKKQEYDAARSEYLKVQGVTILGFWKHEVLYEMESVLSKLEQRIDPLVLPKS